MSTPVNLFGLNEAELASLLAESGIPRFRASQLVYWMYNRRITDFEAMTNLPRALRAALGERYTVRHPELVTSQRSSDGTIKYLFALDDGRRIETVLIPSESEEAGVPRRLTLCMSTQVGCALGCAFCATATMKLLRNLTPGEIVGQWAAVQSLLETRITNLVYMGMGEPMHNYEAVMQSIDIITHEKTCGVSASHITVSTAGLVAGIRRMADEGRKVKLAISLHATSDGFRSELMPINRTHALDVLVQAASYYYEKTRKRVTWEYILFEGRNDTLEDARRLSRLTRRVPSKVNLIPFHPIDGAGTTRLQATPHARIEAFAAELRALHVTVMLRSSSGRDIDAACGQLAVRQERTRRVQDAGRVHS